MNVLDKYLNKNTEKQLAPLNRRKSLLLDNATDKEVEIDNSRLENKYSLYRKDLVYLKSTKFKQIDDAELIGDLVVQGTLKDISVKDDFVIISLTKMEYDEDYKIISKEELIPVRLSSNTSIDIFKENGIVNISDEILSHFDIAMYGGDNN